MEELTDGLTNHQLLLMEIRDELCGGNAAELARRINTDATYVNRLFYPVGKAGRKGIGLSVMRACSEAFRLPPGFWDRRSPALDDATIAHIRTAMATPTDPDVDWPMHRAAGSLAKLVGKESMRYLNDPKEKARARFDLGEPTASYGMETILAWEHPDDLPEGEFVMVPRLDVHLSAGGGRDQVEIELTKENPQAFRTEWIRLMRLKPAKLAAMRASGESMEPTIHDGDSLLVDTSQVDVVDGKVYALWYEGGERVKRLFRLPGGTLRILSDNPRFPPIELGQEYAEHVRIIGRVVHRSGVGGL